MQKLTEDSVTEIRQLLSDGLFPSEIASRFGVTATAIKHIRSGTTWNGARKKTGPKARPVEVRLWENVDRRGDAECWPWLGACRNGASYPTISDGGVNKQAYRVMYELHHGPIPGSRAVRHHCRNHLCMNPAHLYTGSKYNGPQEWTEAKAAGAVRRAKDYYWANADRIRLQNAEYQMKAKIRAINYLGGRCKSCGFDHPAGLQFHHRDPATKSFGITTKELGSPRKYSWDSVIKPELDKCDLLCSNCHFVHHTVVSPERVRELQAEEAR